MPPKASKTVAAKHEEPRGYEFAGPPGAFAISFGLPLAVYIATFLCNDISGCPVPSALSPSTLTIEQLKKDVGWPANGIWGLASWDVSAKVVGYYLLSMVLQRVLPGVEAMGTELASGGRLAYKFNTWSSTMFTLAICAAGTVVQGADFPVWTFIYDNYTQIVTANIIIAYSLATFVYVRSFNVKPGNKELRELAAGGHSGNMLYDWFIGRELNPRVTIPLLGQFDIKEFCELRPGLMGWMVLDFTFLANQYKTYGFVTDSMLLITSFQTLYVLDSYWMESAILTTMDITTDGFGFMLAFGDLVWVPFTYSLQARYLSVYPLSLGVYGTTGVLGVLGLGYYIFRSSNNEKNRFRTDPNDSRVAHLKFLETKSGSKLLISGWWGTARHINYFGDWIQAWAYCLPTGIAGYLVQHSSVAPATGQSFADKSFVFGGPHLHTEVLQGSARGYGMIFTYFYVVYFGILLIHREMRDEEKCLRKYGEDWKRYTKIVKYRIIPGIY
ncbi:Delta(14)-sterol reductase-like protein [Hyaloscypha bicolor E]|uniref:Delta(14)-sterol reductase n=1 Tax=Hyaloscypha bicolor E TaxID=1095630 RepID=A0A2J6T580_9HELO|nr:Delta(14)-sterol reductase-like protein [Hyaloscypha bicolor E]PMD58083.1 Delta(14)-sterol reductase-like protein [Hyaloscypha bicolor E]